MEAVFADLTIAGGSQVFWKGRLVTGVVGVHLESTGDRSVVNLRARGGDEAVFADMKAAGIRVEKAPK